MSEKNQAGSSYSPTSSLQTFSLSPKILRRNMDLWHNNTDPSMPEDAASKPTFNRSSNESDKTSSPNRSPPAVGVKVVTIVNTHTK